MMNRIRAVFGLGRFAFDRPRPILIGRKNASGVARIIYQSHTSAAWRFGEVLINHAQTYSMFGSILLIAALFVFLNKQSVNEAMFGELIQKAENKNENGSF